MYKLQVCHLLVADMCVTIEEEKGACSGAGVVQIMIIIFLEAKQAGGI